MGGLPLIHKHDTFSVDDMPALDSKSPDSNDKTINKLLKKSVKRYKTVIVLGGGHYNVVSNKILERTEYDISYICPKHYLEVLDEEMLKQVLEKSHNKVEMFVLDYKGLGKSKKKVIDLLNKMKLKYVKSGEILTTYE